MFSDHFMLVEKIENDQGRIQTVLSKDYLSKLRLWCWDTTGTSRSNGIKLEQKRPSPGSLLMHLAFKIIHRSQTWQHIPILLGVQRERIMHSTKGT